MTRYVLDALTLVHLVDHDLAVHPDHQLVAPNRILTDALELLLADVTSGARTERAALQVHQGMTGTKIRLLGDRVSRSTAWKIARERGWGTLRDAEYLAVTRLQADALVTVDARLDELARQSVTVVPVQALLDPG